MRTYKSIEKPAQILGMNIMDLGLVIGLFLGSVLLLGFLNMLVHIPRWVYLIIFLFEVGLVIIMRFLTKTRPPGFLLGWLSFTFVQPKRISVGVIPNKLKNDEKR